MISQSSMYNQEIIKYQYLRIVYELWSLITYAQRMRSGGRCVEEAPPIGRNDSSRERSDSGWSLETVQCRGK